MATATSSEEPSLLVKSAGASPKETEETGRLLSRQTEEQMETNERNNLPPKETALSVYKDHTWKSANPSEAASLSASSGWPGSFKHLYDFQRVAVGRGREYRPGNCRISRNGSEAN